VKAVLIARNSPVRTRLAEMLSELPDVQLGFEDPIGDLDAAMARQRPDVVMIDFDQAGGRGLQLISEVRTHGGTPPPVIVALASSRHLRYRESCRNAGAMYFFNTTSELAWLAPALESIRRQLGGGR